MLNLRLYLLQRLSAIAMAPFVLVHIAVMIYAIQGGLSAGEILSRTQGSLVWFGFYALFVVAVSIHAAIGLRVIAHEWFRAPAGLLGPLSWAIALGLLGLGLPAVWGVTFA